jgi:Ca-activated chloride channel family protein
MHGFPLDVAKTLMEQLLKGLNPRDRFNVVLFAGGSQVMAPRSVPGDEAHRKKARNFIDQQQGGGGTELLSALKNALALPAATGMARSVVLISDGYISAERDVFEYIRNHLDQTNMFSFGIGSSVNRYLIEGVARAGQGAPFIATKSQEALKAARQFVQYISQPVLTDIEVTYDGFDAHAMVPAKIPDLMVNRPLILMGKWRGPAQGTIQVRGLGGGGPFEKRFQVSDFAPQSDNQALPMLWARERLMALSDYAPRREHAENQGAITRLGLDYSLLTAYTSFVAVLDNPRLIEGGSRDVDHPLPLPLGVSKLAVGGPLVAGAEPDLLPLAFLMLLLVVTAHMIRKRSVTEPRAKSS